MACTGGTAPPLSVPAFEYTSERRVGGSPDSPGRIAAVAVNDSGVIAVIDGDRSKVLIYSPDGHLQRSFGGEGSGPGEFRSPHLVAIGPSGEVAVADIGNSRITRWDPAGRLLATTPVPAPAIAVAWTDSGWAAAVERGTGRLVYRITPARAGADSLRVVARLDVADPIEGPHDAIMCATCAIAITRDLKLLVSAFDTIYRVTLTDLAGAPLRVWERSGVPPHPTTSSRVTRAMQLLGVTDPTALPPAFRFVPTVRTMGLDATGRLVVLRGDSGGGRSQIDLFNADGSYNTTLSATGAATRVEVQGVRFYLLEQDSLGVPSVEFFTPHPQEAQ